MMEATEQAVRREITVAAPPERAFAVFTERMDTWWPRSYTIGSAELDKVVIEPREGGRWYEPGSTAASACGARCWPTSRRTGSC